MQKPLAPEGSLDDTKDLPKDNIPTINDDKALEDLVGNMPNVVDDAVQAAHNNEQEAKAVQTDAKDKKGRPFNADMHAVDDAGNPIYTPSGRFKSKLRLSSSPNKVNLPPDAPAVDMKIKNAAAKFADLFIITGISFFGDEWKPETSKDFNERQILIDANEKWMIENGYVEPPAWLDLLLAYGLYTGKRVFQPTTKSRVKIIWQSTRMFFTNFWLKITGKDFKVVKREEARDK